MYSLRGSPETQLRAAWQLLQVSHHRNKNQHRLAKWFKSACQLRRQLSKLLSELAERDTVGANATPESKYAQRTCRQVALRVDFIRHHLAPKCYVSFGNLLADNQYAALGLMMMGVLAQVWSVLQDLRPDSEENVLQDILRREEELKLAAKKLGKPEDCGEVIERPQFHDVSQKDLGKSPIELKDCKEQRTLDEQQKKIPVESASNKRKKKRHKKRDVFDDIFDGLV